jgi:hypothetical protein
MGGVNILEDARHCSVLYVCKYFVPYPVGRFRGRPLPKIGGGEGLMEAGGL